MALSYEVLWTRELLNFLGSTTRASTLVLATFMAGLGIGSWVAGKLLNRFSNPLKLYVIAEALLGGIGFLFPNIITQFASLPSSPWAANFYLVVLLLIPGLLMGVTLPSLAAALQNSGAAGPRYIARLYAFNTFGAAAAGLGVGLVALPMFGYLASEYGTAVVGLIAAVFAGALAVLSSQGNKIGRVRKSAEPKGSITTVSRAMVMTALVISGFAALGYEVLWTRILVLIVGSSSNAFTLMLGLYLGGLGIGSLWVGRQITKNHPPAIVFQFLQLGVAAAALAGVAIFGLLPIIALYGFALLGASFWAIAMVNFIVTAIIILPPTIFIGASFPVAARLMELDQPNRGREVALALGLTTAGNVCGIVLSAFVIIPVFGLQYGVAALTLANLAAACVIWLASRNISNKIHFAVPVFAGCAVLVIFILPKWEIAVMTSGVFRHAPAYLSLLGNPGRLTQAFFAYKTRFYREGSEAVVAVFDRPTLKGAPHRVLTIDGKVDASTGADMSTQVLSGHLPFLFRPDAKRALVIGLASGVTVGALAKHPLKRIDVVEIEPAVVEASHFFDQESGRPLSDPRVNIIIEDGRRFLQRTQAKFDFIVSEPSNPWLSLSARLFTHEFFELARHRLASDGLFVQWVPLYGTSNSQFKALLRTLLGVFPYVTLFRVAEGDLIALASLSPVNLKPEGLQRIFKPAFTQQLGLIGIESPAGLLAGWLADENGLRAVVGEGIINTDNNGLLEFGSPWYLLSDTKKLNLSVIKQSWARSKISRHLADLVSNNAMSDSFIADLTNQYIGRGRVDMAFALATALQANNRNMMADLVTGATLVFEEKLVEAARLWQHREQIPFLIQRAGLAFKQGRLVESVQLFEKIPGEALSPEDRVFFAYALAGISRPQEALAVLQSVSVSKITIAGIITTFTKSSLLKAAEQKKLSISEVKRFKTKLDMLRRCLERDGCKHIADGLLKWGNLSGPQSQGINLSDFRQSLFLHITRPLPHFFKGMSRLWLGDTAGATNYLTTYLKLLPEPDSLSKANDLLKNLDQ